MSAASPSSPATPGIQRQFHGCSGIRDYEMLGKLGEGTFGEVHKARSRKTGAMVALKKILMHNEKDGFPITALREIKLLKVLSHVNVLKLEEMVIERPKGEGRRRAVLYMATPYMEHDLSGLLENPDVKFTEPQIKCYMLQLFEGIRYLHDNHILHRDMKAANLLINNRGILQIADFGLARHYSEDVPQPGKGGGEAHQDYTALVVTRWYRPPELLLSLRRYTTAIDLWGAGCVFGEMFKRKPILMGNGDLNQVNIIFDLVGSPTEENMPGWSSLPGCEGVKQFSYRKGNLEQVFREQGSAAISLLRDLLKLDWRKRINAIDALNHPYFKTEPKPARPEDLPSFQDSHEFDRRHGQKAALPPAPAGGAVGMGPNGEYPGSGPLPPPGIANGRPWANGDRGRGGGYGPEYGPPGAGGGHRGHDNRPPPSHAYDRGQSGRHPENYRGPHGARGYDAQRGGGHALPRDLNHPLPPRPGDGRHQLPDPAAYRPPASKSTKDTYIPSYSKARRSEERDELPVRDQRRGSQDSRDGRPPSRDSKGRREEHWRDRDRDRDRRSTRSRSPDRNRRDGARDRDRERGRDRDVYRR